MITIAEARRKLNLLEQTKKDPTLILTDLFESGVEDLNFFYRVSVDEIHIRDYMIEQLKQIPVFSDCKVSIDSYKCKIGVPSLFKDVWLETDLIVKFDIDKKTYKVFDDCIRKYEKAIASKPTVPIPVELDDFYKQFENFDINNRLQCIKFAIMYNKTLQTKLYDIFIALTMSKKKRSIIEDRLDDARKNVAKQNERNMERYEENVAEYEYLKEHVPTHIEDIKQKQKEIETFLVRLGYTMDPEMDKY